MKHIINSSGVNYNQMHFPVLELNIQPGNTEHNSSVTVPAASNHFRSLTESTSSTRLWIKNMVSIRCILTVKAVLNSLNISYTLVELGKVEIIGNITPAKKEQFKYALQDLGLELMEDKKSVLIEKIKNVIIEMIQHADEWPKIKFSEYLSTQLNHNYIYLSNLFSRVKGITIEQFILTHKIERVKQLLLYNELTLSEIAWKLHYSSVAHLSNQFKKITGMTPTHFKNSGGKGLIALENL